MARKYKIQNGEMVHTWWKCHNEKFLLKDNLLKSIYYELIKEKKQKYDIEVYQCTIMDNHVHIFLKAPTVELYSAFMKAINEKLAKKVNKKLQRKGEVIMDRPQTKPVYGDKAVLKLMAYLDLNPVKARKVKHPAKASYTSYLKYAKGEESFFDTPEAYLKLGKTVKERCTAYRQYVYMEMRINGLLESDFGKGCCITEEAELYIKHKAY
ncbi:MAG: transposase, partial [Oligoflexia bacterium]|nr:transposase [Oligoflexia bacterium]